MWHSNESMSSAMKIGAQEGGLYKVTGQVIQALAHEPLRTMAQKVWTSQL